MTRQEHAHATRRPLAIFREIGDRIGEAICLGHLGEICMSVSDDVEARNYFEQCLAIARAIVHRELEGECELYLGELALDGGDLQAARARFERSLEVSKDAENKRGEAIALWWTGKADIASGDGAAARSKLGTALLAFHAAQMHAEILGCIEDHAALLRSLGIVGEAVRICAAAAAARERLMVVRPVRSVRRWEDGIAAARTAIGDAAFDAAWRDGQAWSLDMAIRRALAPAPAQPVTA